MRTKMLSVLLSIALALTLAVSTAPTVHASSPTSTVLAKGTLPQLPDGDLMFRIVDLKLIPSDNAVTHKHIAGMFYQMEGAQMLTVAGKMVTLSPGQGSWIDDQVEHIHATDVTTPIHFLFMAVVPLKNKGAPVVAGFTEAFAAFESTSLTFTDRNKQDVALTNTVFEAGQTSDLTPTNGPIVLNVQDGKFAVEVGSLALTMQKGDYVSVQPNTPVHIVSDAKLGGQLLMLSVIPAK